ncbi:MAG: hypothetical protein PHP52_12905 [Bacteroidales bacterium]|nr:hypothetical protein [Bacteroidales bacterium]MDD4218329.1 hypothetical protein [Bacteroidales bacterium]MDY0143410.1 hypothetical protein [Bacteroidales bacterium]
MKKTLLILTIIVGLIAFAHNKSHAQATADELMEGFFTIFDEDVNQAIDYLFATNRLIDSKQEGIKAIKERLELSRKLLGNYYGWEIVSIYHAGDSYAKYIYSLKYERQPVKFEIVLYKPENVWKVQNVNFQDDLETEFRLRNN